MKIITKIRTYKEIKDITNTGEKFILSPFIIYRKKLPEPSFKVVIGVLLSRKFGKAVSRNYARRRIIALLTQIKGIPSKSYAYVFIPRQVLIKKEYSLIHAETEKFFRKKT